MNHHPFPSTTPFRVRAVAKWAANAAFGVLAFVLLAALIPVHAQPPDSYTITTVAGADRDPIADSAPALETVLEEPSGLAFDDDGNLYITEFSRFVVWRLDASGTVTRVAGNGGSIPGEPGMLATETPLGDLGGAVIDHAGRLHVAGLGRVNIVDEEGVLRVEVGAGPPGIAGDGGPANLAQVGRVTGLAVGPANELYIADGFRVRKVDSTGTITTVAGRAWPPGYGGDGGPAVDAQLGWVFGLAVDSVGNLYIADSTNSRVRKVDTAGMITTVAGSGESGFSGDGGPATEAQLGTVAGLAVDASGNIYISDLEHHRVRMIDPSGTISTVVGDGRGGYNGDNIPAAGARLLHPRGVAVSPSGDLYIGDAYNHRVRRVDQMGMITTVAGIGQWEDVGDGGPALEADLRSPSAVAVDAFDNVYIADGLNSRVRKVDSAGTITTVAGTGAWGFDGDGGPALSALFTVLAGVAVDGYGNLYITSNEDDRVRMVNAGGVVTTVAGAREAGYGGDGGPATRALLQTPTGLATDARGNLYIADTDNHRVRMVNPVGVITTVAGNGQFGADGDGGAATMASLEFPVSVAVDAFGSLYIGQGPAVVRKVDPAGVIATVAGQYGAFGYDGDGGPAVSARITVPEGVAVDMFGNLYIADVGNHVVRRVDPMGMITTVAGSGESGSGGDGVPALEVPLTSPGGVATDSRGNVYIAETWDHKVRKLTAQREPSSAIESLSLWRVASGRVAFSYLSSGTCMRMRNLSVGGKSYTVERSQWWRRSDSSAAWTPVAGTAREGRVCALVPPTPGEYLAVADFSVDGARMTYRSANSLMLP